MSKCSSVDRINGGETVLALSMGGRKHKASVRWQRRWRNVNKYLSSNRATPLNGSTRLRKACLKSTFWDAHWGWCRLNKQDRGNVMGGHRDKSRRNQGQEQSQTLSRTRPKSVKTAFFVLFWSVLSADLKFSHVFLLLFLFLKKKKTLQPIWHCLQVCSFS